MTNLISRSPKRGQRGFTLIELLVVIAIIAILALLILAALNSAQKGARDSRRQSDINQYKSALANYFSDQANYPDGTNVTVSGTTAPCSTIVSNYLASCLTPPSGSYFYNHATGASNPFHICATLERDTANMFAAGPTETSKITGNTAADCATGTKTPGGGTLN